MKGFNVLHTMGWDAFGLPKRTVRRSENWVCTLASINYKKQIGIAVFKKQIQALGFSYDWDREIQYHSYPDYYLIGLGPMDILKNPLKKDWLIKKKLP